MILTWTPPNDNDPVVFSRSAVHYKLLKRYSGFSSIPGEHVYADRAPSRHGRKRKYTALSERNLSFDVMLKSVDLDEQQDLREVLAAAFNPLDGPGILTYEKEDGSSFYLNCIGAPGNPYLSDDKSQVHQRLTINLIADEDPFWHTGSPTLVYFDPSPGDFFPFPNGTGIWPWVLSAENDSMVCTNYGSVDAPIIATFTGEMTNPKLICVKTVAGVEVTEMFSFTLDLADGEELVVNTDPNVLTATYEGNNAHKYADITSAFWQLGRGINTVTLDPATSETGAACSVQYSQRFVGV